MTALDIIEISSCYLNLSDDLSACFDDDNSTSPSAFAQKEFSKLLKCLNLIIKEISSEFLPIIRIEEKTFSENKISLSSLTENINQVIRVSFGGENQKFKVIDGQILSTFNGIGKIEYSCFPEDIDSDDEVDCFDGKINDKTLAMGIASEYCFMNGLFDDASIWEERFISSLKGNLKKLSVVQMPKRRWL